MLESLVLAVVLGMMPAGFGVVMVGMAGVAMSAVGVVRRLLVVTSFVVLGRFAMMARSVLVMLSRLMVMVNVCVIAHFALPVWRLKSGMLTQRR